MKVSRRNTSIEGRTASSWEWIFHGIAQPLPESSPINLKACVHILPNYLFGRCTLIVITYFSVTPVLLKTMTPKSLPLTLGKHVGDLLFDKLMSTLTKIVKSVPYLFINGDIDSSSIACLALNRLSKSTYPLNFLFASGKHFKLFNPHIIFGDCTLAKKNHAFSWS